uniref:VASt domain-containing protein n=1 Tax=Alexandrium catenella TaxID=2925 RepID=A0A7S1S678_ALECA
MSGLAAVLLLLRPAVLGLERCFLRRPEREHAEGAAPGGNVRSQVPGADTFGDEVAQAWAPILQEYEEGGWMLAPELHRVHSEELSHPSLNVRRVHKELRRVDGDSALVRLWRGKNVTELTQPAWAPLGEGLARCFGLRLPLKPLPLAPKSTRVSTCYHLSSDGARSTELAWMSKSLDVPYASAFLVTGKFVFRQDAKGVSLDCYVGWQWLDRCMVKYVIQSESRAETAEMCGDFAGHIREVLS